MKKFLLLLLSVLCISSCRVFERLFGEDIVARVGNDVLYRKDIDALNIKGFSPEDSAKIVSRYIMSWAKSRLLLELAESRLPKSEKDVAEQLEEYRQQLLVYRYEKLYVGQRLDTAVTEDEYSRFYEENRMELVNSVPYFKGIFIKIRTDSPNFSMIQSIYAKTDAASRERLGDLSYVSADKYYFIENWTSLDFLVNESGLDMQEMVQALEKTGRMSKNVMGYSYFIYADEYVAKGECTPYEAARPRMKELILSRRKQELLSTLERNLLNDAINDNKLIIYDEK